MNDASAELHATHHIREPIVTHRDPARTLDAIVQDLRAQYRGDVCSLYLLEPDRLNLVLAGTVRRAWDRSACRWTRSWWAEAFDGRNGFAIGPGQTHADAPVHDTRDADALYTVLRDEIIPLVTSAMRTACRGNGSPA